MVMLQLSSGSASFVTVKLAGDKVLLPCRRIGTHAAVKALDKQISRLFLTSLAASIHFTIGCAHSQCKITN